MSTCPWSPRRGGGSDESDVEWNRGDLPPQGAGLPLQPDEDIPIEAVKAFGTGTPNYPCILYKTRPVFRNQDLEDFNDFARWLCKHLGFNYIWIRAHVHNWTTVRDGITLAKTGDRKGGEDNHLTVYLGDRPDWINVHGDVYVKTRSAGRHLMPYDLRPVEELQLQKGKSPRNLRLYAWPPRNARIATPRLQEAKASNDWRRKTDS